MRAFRRRPWASLSVDMTPLIDVIFLIIIFFIIMINFSEIHLHDVPLPKADEARGSQVAEDEKMRVVVKTEDTVLFEREQIRVSDLPAVLRASHADPSRLTIQIRANENVPYQVIRQIMLELAHSGISQIEFSAWPEAPEPPSRDSDDAA